MADISENSDGKEGLPQQGLTDKRGIAQMLGFSKRTIDNLMAKGMPHMRFGERRVRFHPGEVLDWCRNTFGCQRLGKLAVI